MCRNGKLPAVCHYQFPKRNEIRNYSTLHTSMILLCILLSFLMLCPFWPLFVVAVDLPCLTCARQKLNRISFLFKSRKCVWRCLNKMFVRFYVVLILQQWDALIADCCRVINRSRFPNDTFSSVFSSFFGNL